MKSFIVPYPILFLPSRPLFLWYCKGLAGIELGYLWKQLWGVSLCCPAVLPLTHYSPESPLAQALWELKVPWVGLPAAPFLKHSALTSVPDK